MSSDKSSKTFEATPRRKKEARSKGQVAKSQELGSWPPVLIASVLLVPVGGAIVAGYRKASARTLDLAENPNTAEIPGFVGDVVLSMAIALLPMLAAIMVTGLAVNMAQTGFLWAPKAMKPNFKVLNPLNGFKRIYSAKAFWEFAKTLLKVLVIAFAAWGPVSSLAYDTVASGQLDPTAAASRALSSLLTILRNTAIAGLILGAADWTISWRKNRKDMMMTRREVMDEQKSSEGDPMLRARQRQVAIEAARSRSLLDVALSDVVVTNPTRLAVAIRYKSGEDHAPVVMAKGAGHLAAKIREVATENKVPIIEAKPLARVLWRWCEPGETVPFELYEAVARLLAFVHRLRRSPLAPLTADLPDDYTTDLDLDATPESRRNQRRPLPPT